MKFKVNFILLFLVILGAFLRFYDFDNRFSLGWESNRDYVVSEIGWREKQLSLTGPWASIAPLTTGPWYWYYLIVSRFLIPSVYAPWIMMGLTSVISILVMYKIGVLLENHKLGLVLALITTFSPHLIENSLLLTNTSPIFFLTSVLILIFLYLFSGNRKWYWGILFGWLIGVTLLTHYQGAGLLVLVPLLLFLKKDRAKTFLASLLGLFMASLPILFFELNNHWFNTRGILDFIFHRQYRLWVPMRWKTFIFDFYPQVWATFTGGTKWLGLILMFSSAVMLSYRLIKKRMSLSLFLLVFHFLILIIVIRYWRGERYLGWLQFFAPYIFIFTSLVFYDLIYQKVSKKIFYLGFIIGSLLYLGLIGPSVKSIFADNGFKARDRNIKKEIKTLSTLGKGDKFTFYSCNKDSHESDPYLLLLFLNNNYDKNGFKIAIKSGKCLLPYIDKKLEDIQLVGQILDFNQASESGILINDYRKETKEGIYDSYVKWWYKEKP